VSAWSDESTHPRHAPATLLWDSKPFLLGPLHLRDLVQPRPACHHMASTASASASGTGMPKCAAMALMRRRAWGRPGSRAPAAAAGQRGNGGRRDGGAPTRTHATHAHPVAATHRTLRAQTQPPAHPCAPSPWRAAPARMPCSRSPRITRSRGSPRPSGPRACARAQLEPGMVPSAGGGEGGGGREAGRRAGAGGPRTARVSRRELRHGRDGGCS